MLPLLLALTFRNTPTCVGKTLSHYHKITESQKHPHVRGEDLNRHVVPGHFAETPPRAWGRPRLLAGGQLRQRNTPTCVGKTCRMRCTNTIRRKHPHVRGEDQRLGNGFNTCLETPPRAWGRQNITLTNMGNYRNTPTCVGKTHKKGGKKPPYKKHPHVRGEDATIERRVNDQSETPPRAWGRLNPQAPARGLFRNTPTCVGKTPTYCERARV